MAKIIRFPSKNDGMIALLEEILASAKEGKINAFAFSAKSTEPGGDVMTAYWNVDPSEKHYLASHIQVDAMHDLMEDILEYED